MTPIVPALAAFLHLARVFVGDLLSVSASYIALCRFMLSALADVIDTICSVIAWFLSWLVRTRHALRANLYLRTAVIVLGLFGLVSLVAVSFQEKPIGP